MIEEEYECGCGVSWKSLERSFEEIAPSNCRNRGKAVPIGGVVINLSLLRSILPR